MPTTDVPTGLLLGEGATTLELADQQTTLTATISGRRGTYREVVLGDVPVGYWRLGEPSGTNAADQAGTNPGTYTNTPTLAVVGAIDDPDTAVTFDGTTEYVSIPSTFPALNGSAITAEAWIKTADTAQINQLIFGAYNHVAAFGGWGFMYNRSNLKKLSYWSGTTGAWVESTGTITDTAWHHVAVTVTTGGSVTFYIDGSATGTPASNAPNTFAGVKAIGAISNGSSNWFKGSLDEVAVYGSVLTSGQIGEHHAAGLSDPSVLIDGDTTLGLSAGSTTLGLDDLTTTTPLDPRTTTLLLDG